MINPTRRQFLTHLGWAAASGLARPAFAVPSYLRAYAALYRENPLAAALAWHRNAKWGMFIHYALDSLRAVKASEILAARAVSIEAWKKLRNGAGVDYARLKDRFTAEKFDADFITDLALAAEMHYVNFTTVHRGGLHLFRTSVSQFTSLNSPARRDLVAELAASCRKKGLGLFLYCPPGTAQTEPQEVFERNRTVLRELLTQYGPVAGIWLDGIGAYYQKPEAYLRIKELYAHIRSLQPQCLISFKQGIGSEDFVAPERAMQAIPAGPLAAKTWALNAGKWGDICTVMQTTPASWLYLEGCRHLTADEVLTVLADALAQKANLTLNTAPLPDGSIHPDDVAALRKAGDLIRRYGYPAPALMDPALGKRLTPGAEVGLEPTAFGL